MDIKESETFYKFYNGFSEKELRQFTRILNINKKYLEDEYNCGDISVKNSIAILERKIEILLNMCENKTRNPQYNTDKFKTFKSKEIIINI